MDCGINMYDNQINNELAYDKKKYIKGQQDIIDKFYKEYFTWSCTNIGYWIVTAIFSFLQIIFLLLPYQQLVKEDTEDGFDFMMGFFIAFPVVFYLQPYITNNERNYMGTIYNKIKYLPVSLAALRQYRFKKMLKFILKVFVICAVCQLGMSLLIYHEIGIGNIIHLVLYGFLVPFEVGSIEVWLTK